MSQKKFVFLYNHSSKVKLIGKKLEKQLTYREIWQQMGEDHFRKFPHEADRPEDTVMTNEQSFHDPTQEMRRAKLVDSIQ